MRSKPNPIYDACVSYRTPSGRKVRFCSNIAAASLTECEEELLHRLHNADKFGRRKVASVVGEFTATFITMQIGAHHAHLHIR